MTIRERIARFLVPEVFQQLDLAKDKIALQRRGIENEVDQRVAQVLLKMDPLEPMMQKFHVIFSKRFSRHPEDDLSPMLKTRLFMWAYGTVEDPSFKHLCDWIRNKQGNNTLQKGRNDAEWIYGRAAVATVSLFVDEVGRLSSKYEEMLTRRREEFDKNLPVGEY